MRPGRPALVAFVIACCASSAVACLWDYDTLQMERRQFPDALELVTGRFLRHGEAFYRWRIADRTRRLAASPDDLALHDDLAVAYEKVGETRKAIEVMLEKDAKQPGLYETEANLGTFYIHAGEPEKGLEHIRRAVAINPDAHFGREIQQQRLVEYVLERRAAGATLPLDAGERAYGTAGFARWLVGRGDLGEDDADTAAAVKGVLGMMRFGNHDSPVLLEALGDLLLAGGRGEESAARRLACRAYLRASQGTEGAAAKAYRAMAEAALSMQTKTPHTTETLTLPDVEAALARELTEAAAWHAAVVADEERWIREGEDPEARFDAKYYGGASAGASTPEDASQTTLLLLVVCAAVILVTSAFAWLLARRRT